MMKKDPSEMAKEEAMHEISTRIYALTGFLEYEPWSNVLRGNMHHFRQKIAEFVKNEAEERWQGKE